MLAGFFTEDTIQLNADCRDWQEAVKAGTGLLVRKNWVEERYAEAIIANHQRFGPYMVVAPHIVLAHARPEEGVLHLSMSLVILKQPVNFGNVINDPVKLVITLAAIDNYSHLEVMAQLARLLMNEGDVETICKVESISEVLDIIKRY